MNTFGVSAEEVRRLRDLLLPALETLPMRSMNGHSYTRHNDEAAPGKEARPIYE